MWFSSKKVANFASEGKLLRSDKCSSPKIWKSGHNKPTHIVHRLTTLVFQNNGTKIVLKLQIEKSLEIFFNKINTLFHQGILLMDRIYKVSKLNSFCCNLKFRIHKTNDNQMYQFGFNQIS